MKSSSFTIRAAGADRKGQRAFVAKFPLNAAAPDLREEGAAWGMVPQEETDDKKVGVPGKLVLEEQPGQPAYAGQLEGGLRDAGAGYFLLLRHKHHHNEFVAVPVDDWYNFRPANKRQALSLEDAEAEMKAQRERSSRASTKLAQAGNAKEGGAPGAPAPAREEEDGDAEADSDEEWKDIRARSAARQAIKTRPQARSRVAAAGGGQAARRLGLAGLGAAHGRARCRGLSARAAKGVDDEGGEEVHVEEAHGEDWDHEDEAADDDLQLGSDEEDVAGGPEATPTRPAADSEEEEEGDLRPSQVHRRRGRGLKRMMRETGLEGSEDEDEGSEDDEEESESIEDDEDLDRMAGEVLPGQAPAPAAPRRSRSPSPAAGAGEGQSRKRKTASPPPPGSADAAPAAKRTRAPGAAAAAAAPAAPAAAPAAPAAAAAAPPDSVCGITGAEVKSLVRQKGRMMLADVVAHFKPRLGPDSNKAFVRLVTAVLRLDPMPSADGRKYLVPKD
eukprot:scaffold15.g4213.t1